MASCSWCCGRLSQSSASAVIGPRCAPVNTAALTGCLFGPEGVRGQKARLPSRLPTPARAPSSLTARAVSGDVTFTSRHSHTRLAGTLDALVSRTAPAGTHVAGLAWHEGPVRPRHAHGSGSRPSLVRRRVCGKQQLRRGKQLEAGAAAVGCAVAEGAL
eukprot:scaffold80933_cov30-Phaeocystis_antarctica.AAC.1